MEWLRLENRLREILSEHFASPTNAPAVTLHRIDACIAAYTGRGKCYEDDEATLPAPVQDARGSEWDLAEGY
jgi:hypothetical protein